jgi:hypothetical protein
MEDVRLLTNVLASCLSVVEICFPPLREDQKEEDAQSGNYLSFGNYCAPLCAPFAG